MESWHADQPAKRVGQGVAPGNLAIAVGADEQQVGGLDLSGDKLQQEQRRPVGPVQIVEDHHDGLALRGRLQKRRDGVEEAKSGLVRFERRRGAQVWKSALEFGNDLSYVGSAGAHM